MGWDEEWAEIQTASNAANDHPRALGAVQDVNFPPGELYASASASAEVEEELRPVLNRAVEDIAAAAAALRAWSIGEQLAPSGEGWGAALSDLADRLREHAAGLRMAATGSSALDEEIRERFRGWGTV
ncbi:hypothetical protein ACL02R_12530 [Streptomyces sp. MS19]|uniref:hypothetical protein n=1 Tax=Streptomyces sp. MS19 TaxID=3385972 RepID=UPI0039A334CB